MDTDATIYYLFLSWVVYMKFMSFFSRH